MVPVTKKKFKGYKNKVVIVKDETFLYFLLSHVVVISEGL